MPAPELVELHRVRLRLLRPHVAAHGREEGREVLLVSVTDPDGATGWGECPTLARPGYAAEWTDGAWWVLREVLLPAVAAGDPVPRIPGHPMACGAVADALEDLRLRRAGTGPPAPASGARRVRVAFGTAVGLVASEGAAVAAATAAREAGARLVVLKVRPGWAARPLAAVRAALPDLAVAVDGNGSFSLADLDELRAVDALEPAFLEQPLPADDLVGSAQLQAALRSPVALDEGVTSLGHLEAAIALGAGRALTAKPARLGGVRAAEAAVERAAAAGWDVHVGGMLESGLGRAVARTLAAHPAVGGPCLAGPTALVLADDVVEPVAAAGDGTVAVHRGPGLAPAPDPARLAALSVATWRAGGP